MLNCRACLWRYLQAIEPAFSLRPHAAKPPPFTRQTRFIQTSNHERFANLARAEPLSMPRQDRWRKSVQAAALKKRERKELSRQPAPSGQSNPVALEQTLRTGRRDPSMSLNEWNNRKNELRYLKDPLELAEFVKKELQKDKAKEMLQLVRMASHSMQCIVSWNHIIDYYLAHNKVSSAMKAYNEMKNRAQFPDSYTYTILLRGLSLNADRTGILEKALTIYHSLSAPNSRVKPSIIHTNAVLRVCARAQNMDALWGIAAKIPEAGPQSANALTYVTILNAIRQSLLVNVPPGETAEAVAIRRERGIIEGRRMWEDIIGKAKRGDLTVNEELVCAMGRLLLVGPRPRDWDDVLSLVEQAMDIPRFVPRLGTKERLDAGYPQLRAPAIPDQFRFDDDHLAPSKDSACGDEFLPIGTPGVAGVLSDTIIYAKPSNNALSMIQEACLKIVAVKAADQYWSLLTDPGTYKVKPDLNNINNRLRLLRQNRQSASTVKLLSEGFATLDLEPAQGTFRIAMSTCVRDKNNPNSLQHAGQILDLMAAKFEDADLGTVSRYVELAVTFPSATGADYVNALVRLDPVVRNIRLQLGVGGAARGPHGGATYLTKTKRQDAIEVLRQIYGLLDKLVLSNLLPEEQKRPYKVERARMASFLHRLKFKQFGESKEGTEKGRK